MKKFLMILLLCLVLFSSLFAFEINEQNVYSYFQNDIENSQNFEILKDTYAKLSTGFKKKKFKLKSYSIKNLNHNIYKLTLVFKRKKGIFKMKKTEIVYLWIGSNKIVFLTERGKFSYPIRGADIYKIEKVNDGYRIFKIRKEYEFKIHVNDGKIYLRIKL